MARTSWKIGALHHTGQPGRRLGQFRAEHIAHLADILGRQMLLQQLDQIAELVLQRTDEGRDAVDQLYDLALDQRHQDDEDGGQTEQEREQDEEARQAAADPPALEAGDAGSQDISDREPGGERHQDALNEAER